MADKHATGIVYRADLLWGLQAVTEEQKGRVALLLGFEEDEPIKLKPIQSSDPKIDVSLEDELKKPLEPKRPLVQTDTASYYRIIDWQVDVERMKRMEEPPVFPKWMVEAKPCYFTETETRIPKIHQYKPDYPQLIPWSRIWPQLQRILGANVLSNKPDLLRLVKQVSQGKQIQRIPKTSRYTWAPTAKLLIDINDSNFPYRQDFIRLQQQLIEERGLEGLDIHYIDDRPGGSVSYYENNREIIKPWQTPDKETPLLILSDLGMHSRSRSYLYAWLVFGQTLNRQGIRPTVLMPVAERQLDERLPRYFNCLLWDGNSRLKPFQSSGASDKKKTEALMPLCAWLFPALRVELGLLRHIRRLVSASGYDIGDETEVWHHEATNAAGDEWSWHESERLHYQQRFVKHFYQLSEVDQQQLIKLIGYYHARLPDEIYFEVMDKLIELKLPVPEGVKKATEDFMSMLAKTYQQNPDQQGLDLWVKRCVSRQNPTASRSEQQIVMMAIERVRRYKNNPDPIKWPADIPFEQIAPFINQQAQQQTYLLRQKGMGLEWVIASQVQEQQDDWGDSAITLLKITLVNNPIFLRYAVPEGGLHNVTLNLETDLPYQFQLGMGQQTLEIDGQTLTLEIQSSGDKLHWLESLGVDSDGLYRDIRSRDDQVYRWYWHPAEINTQPFESQYETQWQTRPGFWYNKLLADRTLSIPEWADKMVRDQYGLYAEVNIAGILQTFRWIPPGHFNMGSAEDEKGRYDNEQLHPVTLSQGFWLADTTCTQALWQAVMKDTPSNFKGQNLPVETISWDDVQTFLTKVNKQHSQLNLRLPSEAEWEYACRAGTTSAFNFEGDVSLERVNYRGTWKYESDKWSDGALKQMANVKDYSANDWGLFQMHGNVWEWCQDWYGDYSIEGITDPRGSDNGGSRVLRGGSWFYVGYNCRSAFRFSNSPDNANYSIGFRFAQGHESVRSD